MHRFTKEQLIELVGSLKYALEERSVAFWDWDIKADFLKWDSSMFDLFEIQKELFSNSYEAWEKCLHSDDKERVLRELQESLREGITFKSTFKIVTAHGSIKKIGASGTVFKDESGQATRMIGINWDAGEINSRKMRSSDVIHIDFQGEILNQISDPVYVKSEDGIYKYVNKAFTEYYKISSEDILNTRGEKIFSDEKIENEFKYDLLSVINKNVDFEECNNVEGVESVLHIKKHYVKRDKITISYARDITSVKKIEKDLLILNKFINTSNNIFVICDTNLKVLFFSDQAFNKYELNPVPNSFLDYLPNSERESFQKQINKSHTMAYVELDLPFFLFENKPIDCSIGISQIKTKDTKNHFYAFTITDISDKKNMMKKLVDSSRMASLGMLSSGISHEINNPLAIILSKIYLISKNLEKLPKSETILQVTKQLEVLNSTAKRISEIIAGLRFFVQNQNDEILLPENLKVAVDNLQPIFKHKLSFNSIKFINEVNGRVVVMCNKIKLQQILANLVSNSIDAISGQENPWIKVEAKSNDGRIELSVTDSGLGIPLEHRKNLMTPFFTTKEVGKGTGLGLSICKGFVESMGGAFYYDEKSTNTRFVCELNSIDSEEFNKAS